MINQAAFPILTEADYILPVYMEATGYLSHQYPIDRPEGFHQFQWIQCAGGEGVLITEGETQTLKEHQGMFLYPNVPHQYYATREPWEVYWIIFRGSHIEPIVKQAKIVKSGVYTVTNSGILLGHLKNLYNIAENGRGLVGLECAKVSYMLLLDLIQFVTFTDNSFEEKSAKLQPVFDYVEKNYHAVIKLEDLSQILGVTSQHLCLLFRNIMNMRPMEYVNLVRINKSKEMIAHHRDKRIYEIARTVGFENYEYFCKLFKKLEGITPETFKKLNGV